MKGFRAAVFGIDIQQAALALLQPDEELVSAAVKGIKQPDFAKVIGQAATVENGGHHCVAAGMTGENDSTNLRPVVGKGGFCAQRLHYLGYEDFESVPILELAAK